MKIFTDLKRNLTVDLVKNIILNFSPSIILSLLFCLPIDKELNIFVLMPLSFIFSLSYLIVFNSIFVSLYNCLKSLLTPKKHQIPLENLEENNLLLTDLFKRKEKELND
jgi:hypothetical protein